MSMISHLVRLISSHFQIVEKKREANGVLVFQPPGFEAGDFSKFKATKVENPIKPGDYEVIITFTGSKKVGGIQVQHSAEVGNSVNLSTPPIADLRVIGARNLV